MANTSQNAKLNKLLADSEASLATAQSNTDLLKTIQEFVSYNGPLKFSFTRAWWFFGAGLLLIASAVAFPKYANTYTVASFFYRLQIDPDLFPVILGVLGIVSTGGSLAWMKTKSDRLPSLSSRIARLSSYFHNGLTRLAEDPRYTLSKLDAQFADYRRGNYSRELLQSMQGVFTGPLHNLAYEYHRLHYVDKRKVKTTVNDGKGGTKTETRVVYDHYDRYSLVIDFPWVTGVSVRTDGQSQNDYPSRMDTASPDFNKAFRLTGRSEMTCAKFIKPSTVLHLLKVFNVLKVPNLEFADSGKLCLSFANSDLLTYGTQYSLSSPNEFYAEIAAGVELPGLVSALQWSHALGELHDDNFAASPLTSRQEK
ncbi:MULTISPECIES: hypothetical protein [unclassified Pseudomonas]|uniref:hypothetical protein n=1 Tax=unclassified Pseudomonas TaxID=196821 RepID=UPI002A35A0DD|nr:MULTISPECIES: hypothetical protein [unclassified Pseudomonas]MDX9668788.1 hypothetical protein [Pseudomonas sp. P8_250]WPN37154.1 hypothetical protein QMK53_05775 [Pseudomonas sp. P8_139]WPN41045.1 hypothetical protein QMK55_25605 [Pseudomonas sp. P8_229]